MKRLVSDNGFLYSCSGCKTEVCTNCKHVSVALKKLAKLEKKQEYQSVSESRIVVCYMCEGAGHIKRCGGSYKIPEPYKAE